MARNRLKHGNLILIKIGTEVVNEKDGFISLGKLGSMVEQICRLLMNGKKVVLVTSGAVGIGRLVLRRNYMLSGSISAHIGGRSVSNAPKHPKACAAAGQSGMQSLYETLFSQYDVSCSQILASDSDFHVEKSRRNLKNTLTELLNIGIVPIVNENDVISQRTVPLTDATNRVAWDNDSLAALVACEIGADVMITITDVPGVFRKNKDDQLEMVDVFSEKDVVVAHPSSRVGLIGQKDKLNSSILAVQSGRVKAAIVADTSTEWSIIKILQGQTIGTLFVNDQKDGVQPVCIQDPRYKHVQTKIQSQM